MEVKPHTIGKFLILIFTTLLIFFRFNDFFHSANQKVIEPYGDGFKAYLAIIYHAKYDSTYSHFEGMNYPYGEHVIPAATQPILSNSIKWLKEMGIDLIPYSLGIINFSMLFSLLLCSFFLYLIFSRFKLPIWYIIPVVIGITFLSPQIIRIKSHYGLAHTMVLPVIFYLLLRFEEKPSWKISLLTGLALFVFSQIHFYYFAIISFTISFYFLFAFLATLNWQKLPFYAFHYGLQIILPLVFFLFWMYGNDPVEDRTSSPWGFFNYRAYLEGVFTSLDQPWFEWIDVNIKKIRRVDLEGKAYVGLVAGMASILLLIKWGTKRFSCFPIDLPIPNQKFLAHIGLTAASILIFSFGLPFIIPGLENLLDYTGPIRQFRSIGRFAWTFFYAANIIAFIWLYYWVDNRFDGLKKYAFLLIPVGLLLFESFRAVTKPNLKLDGLEEFQDGKKFTDIDSIHFDRYQAIIPAPYFNIGSDNFWWHLYGGVSQKTHMIAWQTGLPTTSAMLTRTSLSQTINQLQLVTEPYRLPKILEDFPNKKPFLLAWGDIDMPKQGRDYSHLLTETKFLYQKDFLHLYEMPFGSFKNRLDNRIKSIQATFQKDSLHRIGTFYSTDSLQNFIYEDFEAQKTDFAYLGKGGFQRQMEKENVVFLGKIPLQEVRSYVLSIWMHINADLRPRTDLNLFELDENGQVLQAIPVPVRTLVQAIDNNGWALLEFPFELKSKNSQIKIFFQNKALKKQAIYLDELLIRPASIRLNKKRKLIFGKTIVTSPYKNLPRNCYFCRNFALDECADPKSNHH